MDRPSTTTSCSSLVQALTAMELPIVPDGQNSPASFAHRLGGQGFELRIVGSKPMTSSPTSASAIRLPHFGVGRVTVSLRNPISS